VKSNTVKSNTVKNKLTRASTRDAHTLSGAYAMDAISGPDRERFEQHLAGCAECAQEIAGLLEATALLGTAAAEPMPAGLKERVMAAAAATRQEPPADEAEAGPGGRRERAGAARWLRSLAWPGRLALATGAVAAAAVLAVAVVFGVSAGSMRQQLDQAQASSQQIAAVMTAQDAVIMNGQVTGGGRATIVMSSSRRALVFTAQGLRGLPSAHGYELWLIGPAGTRPVGMLPASGHGMAGPVIASGLRQGDHLALTAEPAGGGGSPTAPMMLDVTL
jgi:Anti-sigma-K factor rskA/Putative zinc-finger